MREDNPATDQPGYGGSPTTTDPNRPSWLPPGAVLNPDGSITMPNGTVVPGPPPGYTRDPNTGVIALNPGATPVQGTDPNHPQTDPNDPNVTVNPAIASTYGPGTGGVPKKDPITDPGSIPGPNGGAPPPTGAAGPPASGGGYGTNIGDFTKPFGEVFTAPTPRGLPDAPIFTAPKFTQDAPFVAPTAAQAQQDPGYQFTLGQGLGALMNNRAASGMANSGATGKALIDYGQAAGATQYNNVYNRQLGDYMTNYKTQYLDPYNNAFANAKAEFDPKMQAWQTSTPLIQAQNNTDYQNAYLKWLEDYSQYTNNQDRAFNKFNSVLGS